MLQRDEILERVAPALHPIANYILQRVNICADHGVDEDDLRDLHIGDASLTAQNVPTLTAAAEAFREALLGHFYLNLDLLQLVRAVPLPGGAQGQRPAAPPRRPPPFVYHQERQQLQALRTLERRQKGQRLADAALSMMGWFHWTTSGARVPGKDGHFGRDYAPKHQWSDEEGIHFNDFALWMNKEEAAEPDRGSWMNCWEAAMFSAYKAKLKTRFQLQAMHRRASMRYRMMDTPGGEDKTGAVAYYGLVLSQELHFNSSVPFAPQAGLIPQRGDLLFWGRNEHVGISLGRSWERPRPNDPDPPYDYAMSLWVHNGGTFSRQPIEELNIGHPLRFVPCPFF